MDAEELLKQIAKLIKDFEVSNTKEVECSIAVEPEFIVYDYNGEFFIISDNEGIN